MCNRVSARIGILKVGRLGRCYYIKKENTTIGEPVVCMTPKKG